MRRVSLITWACMAGTLISALLLAVVSGASFAATSDPGGMVRRALVLRDAGDLDGALLMDQRALAALGVAVDASAADPYAKIDPVALVEPLKVAAVLGGIGHLYLKVLAETSDYPRDFRRALDAAHKASEILEWFYGRQPMDAYAAKSEIALGLRSVNDTLIDLYAVYGQAEYAFALSMSARAREVKEWIYARNIVAQYHAHDPASAVHPDLTPLDVDRVGSYWVGSRLLRGAFERAIEQETGESRARPHVLEFLCSMRDSIGAKAERDEKTLRAQVGDRNVHFMQRLVAYPGSARSLMNEVLLEGRFADENHAHRLTGVVPGLFIGGEHSLGPRDVVLHYHVTAESVYVFVFPVATRESGRVRVVRLGASPDALRRRVGAYLQRLGVSRPGRGTVIVPDRKAGKFVAQWEGAARALYRELFLPIRRYLHGKSHLFIVPSGHLHSLPFETLVDPRTGRSLEAQYTTALLPTPELLGEILAPPPAAAKAGRALVLGIRTYTGLAPLPQAESEAAAVAQALGGKASLRLASRGDAVASRFLKSLKDYSILHIAAHASADRVPLLANIVLKDGEGRDFPVTGFHLLQPNVRMRPTLVVLSACSTGSGSLDTHDDVPSLASAFLMAGARAVVATRWPVDDRAAALLMTRFYRELKRPGISVSQALRVARKSLRVGTDGASHPWYWAPYVVVGDGRATGAELGVVELRQ